MSYTEKLLPCPKCGREIDIDEDMYIPDRDWKPTFYDPDSGGEPIQVFCECGFVFNSRTHDWKEFVQAWNKRV